MPLLGQLTVRTKQGQTITVGGLERATSERLHGKLHGRVEELLNNEAAKKAISLAPEIINLKDSIAASLSPVQYIRRSHAADMTIATEKLKEQLDERSRRKLNSDAGQALQWLELATDPDALEKKRTDLNESFLEAGRASRRRSHQGHAEERTHRRAGEKHRDG